MRFLSVLFLAGIALASPLAVAAAPAAPAPSASPAPPVAAPPASMSDLSVKIIGAFASGKIDRSMFSENFNKLVPDAALQSIGPQIVALGKLMTITYAKGTASGDYPVYLYTVQFENGTYHEIIGVDKTGKVDTWALRP